MNKWQYRNVGSPHQWLVRDGEPLQWGKAIDILNEESDRITELEAEVKRLEGDKAALLEDSVNSGNHRVTMEAEVESTKASLSKQTAFANHSAQEVDVLMEQIRELKAKVARLGEIIDQYTNCNAVRETTQETHNEPGEDR